MDGQGGSRPEKSDLLGRRQQRWEILMIARDGRTISANYLKVLVPSLAGLLILSLVVIVLTSVYAARIAAEKAALVENVVQAKQEVKAHQEEVEVMMARLIRAGENLADETKVKAEPAEADDDTAADETPSRNDDAETGAVPPQEAPPAPVRQEPAAAPAEPVVVTDRFSATYDPAQKSLQLSFIVRNKDKSGKKLSGYAFIVLKPKNAGRAGWQILPAVATLENGRPVRVEGGRFFEIARYRTLTFNRLRQTESRQFSSATVWVFDKEGNLLLEQDYTIDDDVWGKAVTG